ncbi:MAG: hypothetical protein VKI83_05560 [Synechococcaceae cyanobacterium]|nr:hypothetical protein [Synechococcaceae cyanobacterium]
MASRRTLNARNLEALGAPALAALLIEVSGGNAVIQRRLRLALASAEGVEGAAQAVRQRLSAIDRARTWVDSRRRKALLSDLDSQHQVICGPIAAADAGLALDLLLRFLGLAEGVLQRCSDGSGAVIGLFRQAAGDLAPLAAAAGIAPGQLAELLAELLLENGAGQWDALIPELAERLGETGLRQLETALQERGGLERDLHGQILIALGDLEAWLEQFDEHQLRWPDIAAAVAQQLLAAGRAAQALDVLDQAAGAAASWQLPLWHDARIAVLEALERHEEAQQERWRCFARLLSIPHLRAYLQALDDFADLEAEERALQLAEAHPSPLLALQFLVGWPALRRAAHLVVAQAGHWDGDAWEVLAPAAERLSGEHPLAATLLLRSMVRCALAEGRSSRYRHAADQLADCERLAARIDAWQGLEPHSSFAGRLRESHATRWSFWQLLER